MSFLKKFVCSTMAILILVMLVGNTPAMTQDHVVNAADLHHSLVQASQQRQANLDKVRDFFSAEPGKRALHYSGMSPTKVVAALSALDSEELAQLASRIDKVNKDFAAGALTNQQLTYIIIALATAVIILVIIEA